MTSNLLDLLKQEKMLSEGQYKSTIKQIKNTSVKAVQALTDSNLINPGSLADFLARYFSLPRVNLRSHEFSDHLWTDYDLMFKYSAIPVDESGQSITLAVADPTIPNLEQDFTFASGKRIRIVVTDWTELSEKLERHKNNHIIAENTFSHYTINSDPGEDTEDIADDDWETHQAPVTQYLYRVLLFANQNQASDIHFEPFEQQYQIRMRIDGLLSAQFKPDKAMSRRLTARIKVLANLNIAERRHPQDGRFKVKISDHLIVDLRVSTLPTLWGEKIVLRLLNSNIHTLKNQTLGMNPRQRSIWKQSLDQPQGLILVTGPTGSGKTYTLYSGLSELDTSAKNITTIEDPVEIQLHGINQVQVNPNIQLTFSSVLKAILRQDPDIIMVGEIRDKETAEMAFRAAQTGHLVLSTLHTNSSLDSLSRLRQIGIPDYLIASCTNLIIAQRLVRRLCPHCKIPTPVPEEFDYQSSLSSGLAFRENPDGCSYCYNGFKGRIGLFELLPFTANNKTALFQSSQTPSSEEVQFQTLWQSGLSVLSEGETSFNELLRVLEHE
ncbi:GspE/PulE family protein [Vibrio salinus]|uniref:GspE/PulE family protein n=1 Tax=Vibrio salinus TaxID=2899784 RepID=UPI001E45EF8D|nr:ATPase, T2SS/T4P/T4SS family [Vibrio salinus]MCE0493377.1 Flp pilus assembly complex ATPase component TadA [Vibrio salinus]